MPLRDKWERQQRELLLKTQQWEEVDNQRREIQKRQFRCKHRTAQSGWAIELMHNSPDGSLRGICLHCSLVIHPSHPLYSVVMILDKAEANLVLLSEKFNKAVDSCFDMQAIRRMYAEYEKQSQEILVQCEKDTEPQ